MSRDTLKAAVLAGLFALVLALMVFVPLWFVLAFLSKLAVGRIHSVTFVVAGVAALSFLIWTFRLVFEYFRRTYAQRAR